MLKIPYVSGRSRRIQLFLLALVVGLIALVAGTVVWTVSNTMSLLDSQGPLMVSMRHELMVAQVMRLRSDEIASVMRYRLDGTPKPLARYLKASARLSDELRTMCDSTADDAWLVRNCNELAQLIRTEQSQLLYGVTDEASGGSDKLTGSTRGIAWGTSNQSIDSAAEEILVHIDDTTDDRAALHARKIRRSQQLVISSIVLDTILVMIVLFSVLRAARESKVRADREKSRNRELVSTIESSARKRKQILSIARLGQYLQLCNEISEAAAFVARELPGLLDARSGALYIKGNLRDELELMGQWGDGAFLDGALAATDCWALRKGQTHAQPSSEGPDLCQHLHGAERNDNGLCIPLASHGAILGLLYVAVEQTNEERHDIDEWLFRAVADQVSLALGNIRLRETLRQQSHRDSLTNLYNRRYLEQVMQQSVLTRARKQDMTEVPFSILMVDVDHFKRFNDTYGHEAGDCVLREVARSLENRTRQTDVVGRFGGEEFIVLLPDTTRDAAHVVAESLRRGISDLNVGDADRSFGKVTVSIGLHTVDWSSGETPGEALRLADLALYQAKRDGRNRVSMAGKGLRDTWWNVDVQKDDPSIEDGKCPNEAARVLAVRGMAHDRGQGVAGTPADVLCSSSA